MRNVLPRKRKEDTETKRKPRVDQGRGWSYKVPNHRMPRVAGSHQNPGEAWDGFSLRTFEGT